jgi:spoIIIJ-associated protein
VAKVVESVGSTYEEALRKGLEELNLKEEEVTVEIVKDATAKKTFFSILEPREVKLLITEKTNGKKQHASAEYKEKEVIELDEATINSTKEKIDSFLKEYIEKMQLDLSYNISYSKGYIYINMDGESSGIIIGHRGENLDALQVYVTALVNKESESRVRLVFDAENYREKRTKSLAGLANREAERVIRTRKSFTFEPMTAFERKAIHTALQNNNKIETHSIGEEPYRKVVIALR